MIEERAKPSRTIAEQWPQMKKSYYQQLQVAALDDIAAKLKLDALHATLAHFKVSQKREVAVCAEAILRIEPCGLGEIVPGDEKVAKLFEMYQHFRRGCGIENCTR